MPTNSDRLNALPARTVADVLAKLAELRQRAKRGAPNADVPQIVLTLRSGREIAGWLLDLLDDRTYPTVLLRAVPTDRNAPVDIVYVPVAGIEAVTIRDAEAFAAPLSFGFHGSRAVADTEPDAPVPTKLELRRTVAAMGESLASATGSPLSATVVLPDGETPDAILSRLSRATTLLGTILREQIADDLGRDAVTSKVQAIELSPATDGLNVSLHDNTLRVAVPSRYGESDLKNAVLAVL